MQNAIDSKIILCYDTTIYNHSEKGDSSMTLNRNTLSAQIYEILRSDILTQKIPCGEKLTLNMLKERFQVSTTPIRDALTRLEKDGLLQYYSNIGVNVIDLDEEDLRELFTFMGDLDALAIRYAATHPDQEEIRRDLLQNLEETRKYLDTPDISQWRSCSDGLHLVFYQYCRNSRLCASALQMRSQITIYSNRYERGIENRQKVFTEHQKIVDTFLEHRIEEAVRQMQDHLQDSLEQALRLISQER